MPGQAGALAPVGHAALDNLHGVGRLLDSLRKADAHDQATVLIGRLPKAGMFGLFPQQKGLADQFRFGREADGTRPRHRAGKTWTYRLFPGTETEEMT